MHTLPISYITAKLYRAFGVAILLLLSSMLFAQGSGNALYFKNTDNLDCGKGLTELAFPFTIEMWVLKNPKSDDCTIMATEYNQVNSAIFSGVMLRINNKNQVCIDLGDGTGGYDLAHINSTVSETAIDENRWTNVAVSAVSFDDIKLYINGLESKTNKIGTGKPILGHQIGANILFGRLPSSAANILNGGLDEVRFWSVARSVTAIRASMCHKLLGSEANLLAYWTFDEAQGNLVVDKSGNKHDGALNGSATLRALSGAPIGDASQNIYANGSIEKSELEYKDFIGNRFVVIGTSGSNTGIHLYRVDQNPNYLNGKNSQNWGKAYFGVFTVTADLNYEIGFLLHSDYCNTCTAMPTRSSNAQTKWDEAATLQHGCELYRQDIKEPKEYVLTNLKRIKIDTLNVEICEGEKYLLAGEWRDTSGDYIDVVSSLVCDPKSIYTRLKFAPCTSCAFYMPNAFSPNADGINDTFGIAGESDCQFSTFHLQVYDRWGQFVFDSTNAKDAWNGQFRNSVAPSGTYIWTLDYAFKSSKSEIKTLRGDVLLGW